MPVAMITTQPGFGRTRSGQTAAAPNFWRSLVLLILALATGCQNQQTTVAPAPATRPVEASVRPPAAPADKTDQLRLDIRAMIGRGRDRVFPALVNISVVTVEYWGGQ